MQTIYHKTIYVDENGVYITQKAKNYKIIKSETRNLIVNEDGKKQKHVYTTTQIRIQKENAKQLTLF